MGIYTTNSPESCEYVAGNCEANLCIVENDAQLQKMLKVRKRLPHLKVMVQWEGELKEPYENCYTVRKVEHNRGRISPSRHNKNMPLTGW